MYVCISEMCTIPAPLCHCVCMSLTYIVVFVYGNIVVIFVWCSCMVAYVRDGGCSVQRRMCVCVSQEVTDIAILYTSLAFPFNICSVQHTSILKKCVIYSALSSFHVYYVVKCGTNDFNHTLTRTRVKPCCSLVIDS